MNTNNNHRTTMPTRHKAHLTHCLDILLQTLTCTPSLDVIPYVWMETQQHPYPDFNIRRSCVRHDEILDWQQAVAVPDLEAKWDHFRRPKDAVEVEAEPSLLVIGEDLGS